MDEAGHGQFHFEISNVGGGPAVNCKAIARLVPWNVNIWSLWGAGDIKSGAQPAANTSKAQQGLSVYSVFVAPGDMAEPKREPEVVLFCSDILGPVSVSGRLTYSRAPQARPSIVQIPESNGSHSLQTSTRRELRMPRPGPAIRSCGATEPTTTLPRSTLCPCAQCHVPRFMWPMRSSRGLTLRSWLSFPFPRSS